jgi:uncharacterized protein (DUF305 family)
MERRGRREGAWPVRVVVVPLALVIAICMSSCSSPDSGDHTAPASKDQPVVTGEPAGFNGDDVAFVNKIIPNCKQGLDMSGLVADRSTNPKVAALAAAKTSVLQSDIRISNVLLLQWSENPDSQTGSVGRGATMKGMVDQATIAKLDSSRGAKFDTLWLPSMIGLDQGAVETANAEIASGKNVDAIGLARQIVDARQADIGQMKQILSG